MKKGSSHKIETNKNPAKIIQNTKRISQFPNLSNQQFLIRTLRLLGVTDEQFQKQTKSSLRNELFPKTLTNPTNSKQFFYICHCCAKNLFSVDEMTQLSMWYPPRTVNDQIQFKKVFFKIVQRLEANGTIPKNIIISKMTMMGEGSASSIIQFLRILSQLSLRSLYIQKYSKNQRLIQIGVSNLPQNSENDINKFYVFPFNQTTTNVESPIKSQLELQSVSRIFKIYIQRYRKKILSLRNVEQVESINAQSVMIQIQEQKQLANTLSTKVNKSIYNQNRAFDRRIIMDKNSQIWKQLTSIPCNYIQSGENYVLKIQGETAKVMSNWKPSTGTSNLIQFNSEKENIKRLKAKCQQRLEQLNKLKVTILSTIKGSK